jgi:hypothetical protein
MTKPELLELLTENLEDCASNVYAEWLDDNDNRKEPTTVNGMLNRLGLQELEPSLKEAESLGLCTLCVDDRALVVRLK